MPITITDHDGIRRQLNTVVSTNENGELHTLSTSGGGSGAGSSQVQGAASDNTVASGNPLQMGGVVRAPVAYDLGDAVNFPFDTTGNPRFLMVCATTAGADGVSNASLSRPYTPSSATATGLPASASHIFNGTAWDRQRGDTVGAYVVDAPTGAAGQALASASTTALASSLVLKASPGNLYGFNVVTGASAGYLMIFDAISAPADGSVTPKRVIAIAANTSVDRTFGKPIRFNTGITLVFSTTGPFTKTASATAFLAGEVV